MTLDKAELNTPYIVKELNCDEELKHRFNSFGIRKGAKISIKKFSLGKKTIEVEVNRTFIALRIEEAKKIEIK